MYLLSYYMPYSTFFVWSKRPVFDYQWTNNKSVNWHINDIFSKLFYAAPFVGLNRERIHSNLLFIYSIILSISLSLSLSLSISRLSLSLSSVSLSLSLALSPSLSLSDSITGVPTQPTINKKAKSRPLDKDSRNKIRLSHTSAPLFLSKGKRPPQPPELSGATKRLPGGQQPPSRRQRSINTQGTGAHTHTTHARTHTHNSHTNTHTHTHTHPHFNTHTPHTLSHTHTHTYIIYIYIKC